VLRDTVKAQVDSSLLSGSDMRPFKLVADNLKDHLNLNQL